MTDPFAPNYGTWRGAVRLALAHAEVATGLSGAIVPDPAKVRRLVFVCHGNICRSAYADVLARRAGMNVASFGHVHPARASKIDDCGPGAFAAAGR